jgi:hypothetical protein
VISFFAVISVPNSISANKNGISSTDGTPFSKYPNGKSPLGYYKLLEY